MEGLGWVYGTALVIVLYLLAHVISGKFDPFAPVWLFLVGYAQVYIVQAVSYHTWALDVRGRELVTAANFRACWALVWFLAAYHFRLGRMTARVLPAPPRVWSTGLVAALCPPLVLWGLFCAGIPVLGRGGIDVGALSPDELLLRSFAFVMMVSALMLIVTGRRPGSTRPAFLPLGLALAAAYVLIWVYNGRRSHALIGVLATVCGFYVPRLKRPSWPVLLGTAFTGALVVAVAIGWRNNSDHERSLGGLLQFVGDFRVERILESLNLDHDDSGLEEATYETVEYGGFLLMMDTVPEKSPYDYGASYIRVISTFIPRVIWPGKPLYGRSQWVSAWMAGSEMEREDDFTGPAIGILGATQLNGGAIGTMIVLGAIASLMRAAYEYFRLHAAVTWTQFFWSSTYYNAWFMVVNDDPLIWFYYNWGFTTLPFLVLMWWGSKLGRALPQQETPAQGSTQFWHGRPSS
jgi:hypothetical protein